MSTGDFRADAQRDATDSIRGYVYQAYQSVLAWVRLNEGEALILEGAEDFDIHLGKQVHTTQIKDLASNLTLRSESVRESINNFWGHTQKNTHHEVFFRFLSTANAGFEQGRPFGDIRGLDYWKLVATNATTLDVLREFLLSLELNANLREFLLSAGDEQVKSNLIQRIKWDLGERPSEYLQADIEERLKAHGIKLRINSRHSVKVLPHLLKHIADMLSKKGEKRLTYGDFLDCFDNATTETIPRSELEILRGAGSHLHQLAGSVEAMQLAQLVMGPRTLGAALPLVDGAIRRTRLVDPIVCRVRKHRVLFLHGSSGVGKTNLATLITREIGGDWAWAGFRGANSDRTKEMLGKAAFEMNILRMPPFIVLDDLNLSACSYFERELLSLVFSTANAEGVILVTSQAPPPIQLLPKLWLDEQSEFLVPYFDETEVAEMAKAHGLSDPEMVPVWARTIWLTTSGHPQLVHARVRNLAARSWPMPSMEDIVKPDDVERVRTETRQRLLQDIPYEAARAFAFRLSLIIGTFSRETAMAIGSTPPPISLPGEILDTLVGPWIEKEGPNQFRISPLLAGAANSVLPSDEVLNIHETIAETFLRKRQLDQHEIGTALSHAIIAKSKFAIMHLSMAVAMVDRTNMTHLSEAMTWLPAIAREPGAHVLPDDPNIEVLFRLAQYKLASSMQRKDDCLNLIGRMETLTERIPHRQLKHYSEWLVCSSVLNTIDVHIPSSTVVRLLSRIIDLADEIDEFGEMHTAFNEKAKGLPRIGDNKPAQILMSYQAVRISGTDDLIEMVDSLEALTSTKRDFLLKVCDSENDFASLLIGRAWWKDASSQSFDTDNVLKKLSYCAEKFANWRRHELFSACLVAQAVIADEYRNDTEHALNIIADALREFPNDVNVINQKGKILFHAKRYHECLEICDTICNRTDMPAVEHAFMLRSAGICAAEEGNWKRAAGYFLLGAERADQTSVQKPMVAGLIADAAVAHWRAGEFATSLQLFAQSLTALAGIPFNEELQNRHVHATVRHCVAWIHFQARGEPNDLYCPPPGTCSNQSPHEGMKDFFVKDLGTAWQLLAGTEKALRLSTGIAEKGRPQIEASGALIISVNERSMAFDLFWKDRNINGLIEALQEFFEGLECTKAIKREELDGWSPGHIPPLPDGYWLTQEENLAHFILVGGITAFVTSPDAPLPVAKWRTDLTQRGGLTAKITKLLDVFDGEHPGEDLHEQAAGQLMHLKSVEAPAPYDLWVACFRLLNAVATEPLFAGPPLEEFAVRKWRFAVTHQRFAFSTPALTCSAIEKCCTNGALKGLARVAAILEAAAPALRIPLAQEGWGMLRMIREEGLFKSSTSAE